MKVKKQRGKWSRSRSNRLQTPVSRPYQKQGRDALHRLRNKGFQNKQSDFPKL